MLMLSNAGIIRGPVILVSILLILLLETHITILGHDIDDEYERIEHSLDRSSKMLSELDFILNHYVPKNETVLKFHDRELRDGACLLRPTNELKKKESGYLETSIIRESYGVVGRQELCDFDSALALDVERHIASAPLLMLLYDLDDTLFSIHYMDVQGYIIVSPETVVSELSSDFLRLMQDMNWSSYHKFNVSQVKIQGPYRSKNINNNRPILSLVLPVYTKTTVKNKKPLIFQGVAVLNIDVDTLLNPIGPLHSAIGIMSSNKKPPDNAYKIREIQHIGNINIDHKLYYKINMLAEFKRFLWERKTSLIMIVMIYFLSVLILKYINSYTEKDYFKELASRDPLTGLRNRRGFESFFEQKNHESFIAIALIDIDDFKKINDTYGHDVGDKVIQFLAKTIKNNIRTSDTVSRFGGEEFVIYLTNNDKRILEQILKRVQSKLNEDSVVVVEHGFTISGGVSIYPSACIPPFNDAFKNADDKLYYAKRHGKNRLVF